MVVEFTKRQEKELLESIKKSSNVLMSLTSCWLNSESSFITNNVYQTARKLLEFERVN